MNHLITVNNKIIFYNNKTNILKHDAIEFIFVNKKLTSDENILIINSK